ncbi:aminotransferase class IV family protein [soil metagenome]
MFPLIETIRLVNGEFNNLEYHVQRMRRAWRELYSIDEPWDVREVLTNSNQPTSGLHKCRLVYDTKVTEISFEPYHVRGVNSLRMITDDSIQYSHKFRERRELESNFKKRGQGDDVLIIKNGHVTDTTYANIIFKRGGEWFTPSSCLLQGTMRQWLIDKSKVHVEEIAVAQIARFEKFKLINSMLLDEGPEVSVSNIVN